MSWQGISENDSRKYLSYVWGTDVMAFLTYLGPSQEKYKCICLSLLGAGLTHLGNNSAQGQAQLSGSYPQAYVGYFV